MFNFLLSLCILCISLTPQNGVLLLRDSTGEQLVNHNFTYESRTHVYDVTTASYWLNSVSECDVFFFHNVVIWHYIERPDTHPGEWTLKIYHRESDTWVAQPKKSEDYIAVPIQDGHNTYDFVAIMGDEEKGGFFKFEYFEIFTVWREKK